MAGTVKPRSELLTYIDQVGGIDPVEMENLLASLVLAPDTREAIRAHITRCGALDLEGIKLLVNSVSYKEPPSQQASRINFLNKLDACGRFSRAEWVEFLNKTYLVNEGQVIPATQELLLAVVDNGDGTMTLEYDTDDTTLKNSPVFVCIGSSSMEGIGASAGFTLADRLQAWLPTIATGTVVFQNLGKGGYYTDRVLPDGASPEVDITRNITRALYYKTPGKKMIVLCWLASNDASINTNSKMMENYEIIDAYCKENGILLIVMSTSPRTAYDAYLQQVLYDGTTLLRNRFKERFVDNYDLIRDITAPTVGVIKPEYNAGDNIHLNNTGHGVVFENVKSTLLNYFVPNTGAIAKFTIEVSDFAAGPWTVLEDNIPPTTISKIISPKNSKFYQVKFTYVDPTIPPRYTNVDTLYIPITTTIPPPAPGAQRVLIDFGGNGVAGAGELTPSPDGFGNAWNNVNSMGNGTEGFTVLTNAKDTTGAVTSLSLKVIARADGTFDPAGPAINNNGAVVNVGDYPASAVRDNTYLHISGSGEWQINGLLADRTYSFKFWGNRVTPENRVVMIRRKGETNWQEYNSSNNTDYNVACIFTGITGVTSINFEVRVKAPSSVGHVSVLDIQSISNTLTTTTTTTTTIPPNTQRMLVDIGGNGSGGGATTPSPDSFGHSWNNITDTAIGLKLSNMLDVDGNQSGHTLEFLNLIGGTFGPAGAQLNYNGPTTVIGDYPATAVQDNIYAHSSGGGQWKIGGLRPNYTYRFKFWGSRIGGGNRFIEMKRSTDSVWKESNTGENTNFNNAIVFDTITGITEIIFDIRAKTGGDFGHISVVDIEAVNNAITTTTTTTTTTAEPPTTQAPDVRRVLLDIGGDGSTTVDGSGNPAGQTTNIDFNGRKWNNLFGHFDSGKAFPGTMICADGTTDSGIGFTITNDMYGSFPGTGTRGFNPDGPTSNIGDYPASATRDAAYVHSSANGQVTFSGLNPSKIYRIKFWGSRINTTGVRTTRIQYGSEVKMYNAVGNLDYNTAAVFVVGGLSVYNFSIKVDTADGSTFGALNIVDIGWNA